MKKKIYTLSILFSITILTACNTADVPDIETDTSATLTETSSAPPTISETEETLLTYETKYHAGEFTLEDYHTLAKLYEEQGMIRRQRDLLEQCYRLYGDEESFLALQNITVNISEEAEPLQQELQLLLQNLSTQDYFAESIHQIESPHWMELFMPKPKEGSRHYYLEEDQQIKLVLHTGYNDTGKAYTTLWYHGENNSLILLNYSNGVVQILNTSMINNLYEGPFTLTLLDSVTGSIAQEQGTFANGIYSDGYTLKIFKGDAPGDPYDLWNNRENMIYTTYTATADEQGMGDLEQFASKLDNYPYFDTYQPILHEDIITDDALSDTPQIRIYDGEVQWWNSRCWQSIGSISQYQMEDPFFTYEQQKKEATEKNEDEGIDWDSIKLPKPKPSKPANTHTNKPSVQTPSSTPAPSPAPTPTPVPTPTPEPDDDVDDEPAPEPTPDPEPDTPADSDDGSNDADVEWTPDIM